jgi:hypothetical protein
MRQKGFTPILIIILVALTIFTVYYFGAKKENVKPTSSVPSEIECKYKDSYSAGSDGFLDTHVVVKGDTLLSIAKNILGDVSRADELARLNHDKYPNLSTLNPFLEVGWVLNLPPEGVERTNGLILIETGRLSIGDKGWGTGYPQKSQRYKLKDLNEVMLKQDIKEGECVVITYEGNDVSGAASGLRVLKMTRQ